MRTRDAFRSRRRSVLSRSFRHRLEGHRQRDEGEGQTFTKKVGQLVLPDFLSVTDDPTLKEMNGIRLAGYYDFDDEGVPAQKVEAVETAVLRNFLMSRMPIKNFSQIQWTRPQAAWIDAYRPARKPDRLVHQNVPETELRRN